MFARRIPSYSILFILFPRPASLQNYGKTIRFFATGLFTIHKLIYNLPMPGLVFFRRRAPVARLSRMDFHIITSPGVAATWNTSLFARDSAKNFPPLFFFFSSFSLIFSYPLMAIETPRNTERGEGEEESM